MSKRITKTELSVFRGATTTFELVFEHSKDFIMLFGENGSGKSTILDAIDVVCNETLGCLDDISVGQNPGKYLCSLGGNPANLQVVVHSNSENWTGKIQRNAIAVAGKTERPKVKILRRNKLLDLITAQPSDRYKALSRFIDFGVVERSEANLLQKINETNQQQTKLASEKVRMSSQLESLWLNEGTTSSWKTAMEWATAQVKTSIKSLSDKSRRLDHVVKVINSSIFATTDFMNRRESLAIAREQLKNVALQITSAPNMNSATAIRLIESLDKVKTFIECDDLLDKCPACQRPIDRTKLLGIISSELEGLSDLKKLSDENQQAEKSSDSAVTNLNDAKDKLVQAMKKVQEEAILGDIAEIASLTIEWPLWDQANDNVSLLVTIRDQLTTSCALLEKQRDSTQRDVGRFNSIEQLLNGIIESTERMADLDRIKQGLQRAYEIVHGNRVASTQCILDGIQQEADRLYQSIHPGENIGLAQLKMDQERRGSVSQTGNFNGHSGIPPQAVFSESHMDTLGFCVWLALAKLEQPEGTILLIDDIFSSVDATHLGRVIDLIKSESSNFLQVIVATHYRLWWDRCQNAQGIQRIHLGSWSAANGIASQNMPRVLEDLRTKVKEAVLDRQAVSSRAGILLESILDELALLFQCSLPRNKLNQYTLGALLDGCGKLFSKQKLTVHVNSNWGVDGQAEDWQATNAQEAFESVKKLLFIRNQVGCHFNLAGTLIPDNEVRDFGKATIEFVEALTCPNCGALATRTADDGTHLRCTCTKRAARMTPVAI